MSFRSTLEYINTLIEICQLLFSHFLKLFFVIQHAVAIALEVGVRDLLPELLADALILLRPFQAAGTVATCARQTIFNNLNHFLIFVELHCHHDPSFQFQITSLLKSL